MVAAGVGCRVATVAGAHGVIAVGVNGALVAAVTMTKAITMTETGAPGSKH